MAVAKCLEPSNEKVALGHLEQANSAYLADSFQEALREYRVVYDLCRSTIAFFGIGNSQAGLGNDVDAAQAFDRYLRGAPDEDAELREEAGTKLRDLSTRLLIVDVQGVRAGAHLSIDGTLQRDWTDGAPLYLRPGAHALRLDGDSSSPRTVTGVSGQRIRLDLTAPDPSNDLKDQPVPPPPSRRRWWILGGVAGAVVAGAVVAFALTRPDRPPCHAGSC